MWIKWIAEPFAFHCCRCTLNPRPAVATIAPQSSGADSSSEGDIEVIDHERILRAANEYLSQPPITITAYSSPRSKGGKHDYFSEGDYWWPDPKNPEGPVYPARRILQSAELQQASRGADPA